MTKEEREATFGNFNILETEVAINLLKTALNASLRMPLT